MENSLYLVSLVVYALEGILSLPEPSLESFELVRGVEVRCQNEREFNQLLALSLSYHSLSPIRPSQSTRQAA